MRMMYYVKVVLYLKRFMRFPGVNVVQLLLTSMVYVGGLQFVVQKLRKIIDQEYIFLPMIINVCTRGRQNIRKLNCSLPIEENMHSMARQNRKYKFDMSNHKR